MITTEKPKAITITIRDKKENRSKSFVIYGASLEDVYVKLQNKIKEI